MNQINTKLIEKLAKYKLKIMIENEDGFQWVQCVIRVQISPCIKFFSNDVWYSVPMNTHPKPIINTLEMAINACLEELDDRINGKT